MRRRKEGWKEEGRIVNTNKLTRRVLFPYLIGLCVSVVVAFGWVFLLWCHGVGCFCCDGLGKDLWRGGGVVHECFFRFRALFNINSDNLRMVTPIYKWCWVLLWVQV